MPGSFARPTLPPRPRPLHNRDWMPSPRGVAGMSIELHITRAEHWAENQDLPISAAEWLAYVERDPELSLQTEGGPCFAVWSGPSRYAQPWLDWFEGNIHTRWPDTALYRKMLRIAADLEAQVQDDDGQRYELESDWTFDPPPATGAEEPTPPVRAWWRRLLGT